MRLDLGCCVVFAFVVALGCQPDTDHPPPARGCSPDDGCTPPPGTMSPGSGGPGSGGQGGQAGQGGQGGVAEGQLSGIVLDLIDDSFRVGVPFLDSAVVETPRSSTGLASARWDGNQPFALSGFARAPLSWVRVRPERAVAWLPTIHPIDTQKTTMFDLGMAETEWVDFIMMSVTPPSERFLGRGHVAFLFVRDSDPSQGVPGVSVSMPDAGFVAYGFSGAAWSNLETATDGSGLVFAGNIVASAFPGSTKVAVARGPRTLTLDLRIAADSVTIVEVPIP